MTNWIADENPFNMPAPPDWWLTALADLHPRIVIFPGITEQVYRVAERLPRRFLAAVPHPETVRMVKHGCVPLCSLLPTIVWNEDFLKWLDAHDKWALAANPEDAGAAAADRLDELDRQHEQAIERAEVEEAEQRGVSAYFAKQARKREVAFVQSAES